MTSLQHLVTYVLPVGLCLSAAVSGCKPESAPMTSDPHPGVVDTLQYTDVIVVNSSALDSVKVWVTLGSSESVIGKFGIVEDSTLICDPSGSQTPCIGWFWAHRGVEYHLGTDRPCRSAVVSFGDQQRQCKAAQEIGWSSGINIFEFTVNTWVQDGVVTGANESADISLVDGVNSFLRMSVTSNRPRSTDPGLNPNFCTFWDYGLSDGPGGRGGNLYPFSQSANSWPLDQNIDIPGVYPYGCDLGYASQNPPLPLCWSPQCSDRYPGICTSQLNRPGQGGILQCEFLGLVPEID